MPHIVIGIICHNRVDATIRCINSVLQNTNFSTYSLMFVDNNSTDDTSNYLAHLNSTLPGGVRIFSLSDNFGFSYGCNVLIDNCYNCDSLVILNNDTVVPSNWLYLLHSVATSGKYMNVGMVGCRIVGLSPDEGRVIHGGINKIEDGSFKHFDCDEPVICDLVNGACMLITRSVIDSGLRFDYDTFGLGYMEELDFQFRIAKIGYSVVYNPIVKIGHELNGTSKSIVGMGELFWRNWGILKERWGIVEK